VFSINVATVSWRWRIGSTAASGWESQLRRSRAPMGWRFVQCAVETGIARGVAMLWLEDFEMAQRRVIEREEIRALIERQAREVFDVAPEILHEVMQRTARRADGRSAILQSEAVERGDFEMLAHGEDSGLRGEGPIVVGADGPAGIAEQIA
jgi:hypothetical protein